MACTDRMRRLIPATVIAACLLCGMAHAIPLSQEKAGLIAKNYIEARYDHRYLAYQAATEKLKIIQALDAELIKRRLNASFTHSHAIWKAARANLLSKASPSLDAVFSVDQLHRSYQKAMADQLSETEADETIAFINSMEGAFYFRAERVDAAQKAIQGYSLFVALSRSNLPEFIPLEIIQADLKWASEEAKNLKKPDKESVLKINEKIRVFGESQAWKKLQQIERTAALLNISQLAAEGHLHGAQGLFHQIVSQALEEFNKAQASQDQ